MRRWSASPRPSARATCRAPRCSCAGTRSSPGRIRHCRGRGGAPLACEHRQLAEVAAGHERAIDDAAVGDLHGALLEKVHRVARVVQLEGTVALEQYLVRGSGRVSGLGLGSEQHLRAEHPHELVDEDVVASLEHGHLEADGEMNGWTDGQIEL
eukprot:scaffold14284_cov40-Phaeocystis_antarctica.AAC.2